MEKEEIFLNELRIDGLGIDFQRTLRIPDDGSEYPLPPGLGTAGDYSQL